MHTIMQHGVVIISCLASLFSLEIGWLTMDDWGLEGEGSKRKRLDGKGSKMVSGVWCGK